jgi:hypothetical protein
LSNKNQSTFFEVKSSNKNHLAFFEGEKSFASSIYFLLQKVSIGIDSIQQLGNPNILN